MNSKTRILGLFFITALAVYSGPVNPGDAATSADQPDNKPAVNGVSVTGNQVTSSDNGTIELHVNDTSLLEVLRMLSLQSHLNIIASKSVTGSVSANLYNVTVPEALDAILQINGCVCRTRGNFIYVCTPAELAEMEKSSRVMGAQVFHLHCIPPASAAGIIKPALSPEGQVDATTFARSGTDVIGASNAGGKDSHGNQDMLVVTDYTDNLETVGKILKEVDSAYAQLSEEQLRRAEELRVGLRKGMLFFGQERLAEIACQNAVAALNKPNPDPSLALWHLDAATNLNPGFREAIELKEKVSGLRVTESDNSTVRDFVRKAILKSTMGVPPMADEKGKP